MNHAYRLTAGLQVAAAAGILVAVFFVSPMSLPQTEESALSALSNSPNFIPTLIAAVVWIVVVVGPIGVVTWIQASNQPRHGFMRILAFGALGLGVISGSAVMIYALMSNAVADVGGSGATESYTQVLFFGAPVLLAVGFIALLGHVVQLRTQSQRRSAPA